MYKYIAYEDIQLYRSDLSWIKSVPQILTTVVQSVPLIVSPITAALQHMKLASAGVPIIAAVVGGHDKRDNL
jgi:hypothetical protein